MQKGPEGPFEHQGQCPRAVCLVAATATAVTTATAATSAAAVAAATRATAASATAVTATTGTTAASATAVTAAATTTTTETTTRTGGAWLHRTGFVHDQAATTDLLTVHGFDRCLSLGIIAHLDKAKTF